jgi:transposase
VIWDGSPIHRAKEIKAFLKRGVAKRLYLERLPGYAPELDPQEGVWNLLKRRELKNLCCRDISQVADEFRRAKERLRHRQAVLQQCLLMQGALFSYPCRGQKRWFLSIG